MNRFIISVGCAAALVLSSNAAIAQGRGNGGPKVKTTGAAAKTGGSAHGGGKAMHGGGKTTTSAQGSTKTNHGATVKAGRTGGSTTTTTNAKSNGPKSKTTAPTDTTTTSASSTKKGKTSITTTSDAVTLSAVQQKLQRNTNLASKLESRLPGSMTLMEASEGFTSLGQFVSTVNAAHNHELDFTKLKTAILDEGMSLGQAMKDQRTSLDGTTEAVRATRDADALIKSTETVSTTETTAKAKTKSSKDTRR